MIIQVVNKLYRSRETELASHKIYKCKLSLKLLSQQHWLRLPHNITIIHSFI